jgi:uncharacterized membrane protein
MTLDFFWGALIAGCVGAVIGSCVTLAAQWREKDINRWDKR